MLNFIEDKREDSYGEHISYQIKFESPFTRCYDLYGTINRCKNGDKYDYQIVVTYQGCWIYQEFADTLEEAKELVEKNKWWLYQVAKDIDEETRTLIYHLCNKNKRIIDRSGYCHFEFNEE